MQDSNVEHGFIEIMGYRVFVRQAGPPNAPVLLLPHGYPCSSFQFRRLMPMLADRWRTVAFDWFGFGYSDTPDRAQFKYDFDSYADQLAGVTDALKIERYVLWLHDYGSQIGLRHAISRPHSIAALIIQNGDIYEDELGPKYETIKTWWADKTSENHKPLEESVSENGFQSEFIGEVNEEIAKRVPPDLWKLHWLLMNTIERRRIAVELMEKLEANLSWFPAYQAFLRESCPPSLILWGPEDSYMPAASALAYYRDLPDAQLHLLEGAGHWLLETHFDEALPLVRNFLQRVYS
jgi:pimeloyl-ACP methyl ester carboxylesterase